MLSLKAGTTQIDHLVISRFGIFVVETKHMSGWIFGGAGQRQWTQVHKGGKRYSFQNPIFQNKAHVSAVRNVLDVDISKVFNVVVFTGQAEPKTNMPGNVAWGLRHFGRIIGQKQTKILSAQETRAYTLQIQRKRVENTPQARRDHIKSVQTRAAQKRRFSDANKCSDERAPVCAKCAGPMVKRINGKTQHAFWGCKAFPKCRGSRSIS